MRVAAAHAPPAADTPAALAAARGLAEAAAGAGAALLVLPQRFAAPAAEPEPSDGPTSAAMREAAARTGVALLYGYVERCTGLDYDSLQLVDGRGRSVLNYRRAHLAAVAPGRAPAAGGGGPGDPDDDAPFARGQWLSAMPLGPRRLGLLAGYDLAFPEPARALRLVGCDLLAVAGGARGLASEAASALLLARALENACCVAFASADPAVAARVLGPDGRALAASDGSALAVADLPGPEGRQGPLADRRPRLYQRLTEAKGP